MNLPWFHKPARSELAELRDRLIVAETRAMLLEDIALHQRRPIREPRKDDASIMAAKTAMTARLRGQA